MAFDALLADRIRTLIGANKDVEERRMFGGLAFLVRGHMSCGVVGETLMVRVGPEQYTDALARPHAREMDFTGRALKGFVYVAPIGVSTAEALKRWLELGTGYARQLPPKKKK